MSFVDEIFCRRNLRLLSWAAVVLLVGFYWSHPSISAAQTGQKAVDGRVVDSSGQPLPGAIVYLKNGKTDEVKSFISSTGGSYRFGQLSPDINYEIWAAFQGKKSPTKTVSSFDSKKLLSYDLKVDTGK